MKRIYKIIISLIFIILFSLNSFAQNYESGPILIILPERSIEKFVTRLLPYEINSYKNFSGSLWIKSIKNLKIEKNKISFSSHIYAEDIVYKLKIGDQVTNLGLGNITLFNDWISSFRFDAHKKIFYIKPILKKQVVPKEASDKETLITTLFQALSGIEYPIDLREIIPITTELFGKYLTINFEISDIYASNNELTVKIIPKTYINQKDK